MVDNSILLDGKPSTGSVVTQTTLTPDSRGFTTPSKTSSGIEGEEERGKTTE